ncbi:oxidoreductase NAD-binding domain-containing protein 1-like [Lingula anatina]|uniref:Oxidoreductase NAD-binding domain-containing protein 1-like n=1 Tax=Lingula anatina TaxID=7574 RepID=A0A1S3JTP9_LINAN|nr:oxidoreductase NAD-binding domain-containing protein 1-like [Lingula anatina]|eukprot:XP_013413722.1 oxidoreductase NAD-binding domain-containing protein 1-like [Lingula anatina]
MTTVCKEGDAVSVRAGGDFYYDPQTAEEQTDLLLVAGGVGKNPIYSILQHFVNLQLEYCDRERKVVLLYSSSAREELLYRDHIKELADKSSKIFYKFFVTQQPENKESTHMRNGRIGEDDVTEALEKLNTEKLLCYICGPSTMSNAVEGFLLNSGVPKNKIMYEKWW